jgi:phosphoglycerol transferase MdoB-like AlkP superfamily enzyme
MTNEGLYFTSFYANSFRTDRALVSIHSGLPAQPTMSVMDMPRKSTSLPSIASILGKKGYYTVFYYGGDINYSNMRSYFVGTGFQKIISDADFPISLRTGKWGVADGGVFDRILTDIKADKSGKPFFRSFMTGSSHEPFDVPDYHKIKDDEVLNAFSYTDHCLGHFVEELKKLPCWRNTLVAIVPDHLGAFPDPQDNYQLWRYHVPFVILGGQIPAGVQCHTIGSQIDIAATLLGLLGIDHHDFLYSKDMLDIQAPHFAFFTFPDAMGMITDTSAIVYDNTDGRVHLSENAKNGKLLHQAKAYLQRLYDDLDKR